MKLIVTLAQCQCCVYGLHFNVSLLSSLSFTVSMSWPTALDSFDAAIHVVFCRLQQGNAQFRISLCSAAQRDYVAWWQNGHVIPCKTDMWAFSVSVGEWECQPANGHFNFQICQNVNKWRGHVVTLVIMSTLTVMRMGAANVSFRIACS